MLRGHTGSPEESEDLDADAPTSWATIIALVAPAYRAFPAAQTLMMAQAVLIQQPCVEQRSMMKKISFM